MEAYKIEQLNKSYADKVIFDDLNTSTPVRLALITARAVSL